MSEGQSRAVTRLFIAPTAPSHRLLDAAVRRLRFAWSYLRWRPRFAAYGFGSLLESPVQITNPRFISIGRGVHIRSGARIEAILTTGPTPHLQIGDGTSIHMHFHCGAALDVRIGRNVLIAGRVYITDHDHAFDDPDRPPVQNNTLLASSTVVEDDCWLGEGAIVLKGVRIERGSVVAAGSVVTRDVPALSVVAGVPARVVRSIARTGDLAPCSAPS